LHKVATDLSVNLGKISKAPTDDLIVYHTGKTN